VAGALVIRPETGVKVPVDTSIVAGATTKFPTNASNGDSSFSIRGSSGWLSPPLPGVVIIGILRVVVLPLVVEATLALVGDPCEADGFNESPANKSEDISSDV
jgi:hypothetical protein